jgi:hypothetical protein
LNVSGGRAIGVAMFAILVSNLALSQAQHWSLPVPDGGDTKPSPPSVHGYLVAAAKQRVKVKRDSRDASVGTTVNIQLTSKTGFFTAMAGITVLMNFVRDSMFGSGKSQQICQKQERPLAQQW